MTKVFIDIENPGRWRGVGEIIENKVLLRAVCMNKPELTVANPFKMKFTLDKQDAYSVLSLDEENLNSLIAPDLKSEFIFLRNEGVRNLIFDMSNVKYVDSSGLSAILTANRLWKDYGSYVITGISHPSVEKLIKISRLDTILALVPTVAEAIDYVYMEDAERQLNTEAPAEEE